MMSNDVTDDTFHLRGVPGTATLISEHLRLEAEEDKFRYTLVAGVHGTASTSYASDEESKKRLLISVRRGSLTLLMVWWMQEPS